VKKKIPPKKFLGVGPPKTLSLKKTKERGMAPGVQRFKNYGGKNFGGAEED